MIAIIFAGLPLAYLWTRPDYRFFTKLNWILVFMTFDLIVFGAFTRLTDSGLGCPDWPGCYGPPIHGMRLVIFKWHSRPCQMDLSQ